MDPQDSTSRVPQLLRKVVSVNPGEVRALALGFLYYFLILGSYYILRPIRDTFGLEGGVENLAPMFTGSLVVMLFANTMFSSLVARFSRRRFIPIAYRFFISNILIFFVLLHFIPPRQSVWVGRAFFIWVSVFNLFVLSVFWAFMVDVFSSEQGKRLFGFISVGGTLGAIVGAAITARFVDKLGVLNLLLISAVMVELSARCVRLFPSPPKDETSSAEANQEAPVGGGVWAGLVHNLKSPYLMGISCYMLLYAITSTLLYFQQAGIVNSIYTTRDARTALFAQIDLVVNLLTLFIQIFLTGKLLKWLGVGVTLAILPALSVVGFASLGVAPTLVLLVGFVTIRRAANFALARPARETLFTVVSREDKYKSKNFIDTIVYRTGDQLGAWTDKLLKVMGLGLKEVSLVAAPVAVVWLLVSLWLGRRQKEKSAEY